MNFFVFAINARVDDSKNQTPDVLNDAGRITMEMK